MDNETTAFAPEAAVTSTAPPPLPEPTEQQVVEQLLAAREKIYAELGKVIIGQRDVIEQILLALLSGDRKSTRLNSSH